MSFSVTGLFLFFVLYEFPSSFLFFFSQAVCKALPPVLGRTGGREERLWCYGSRKARGVVAGGGRPGLHGGDESEGDSFESMDSGET